MPEIKETAEAADMLLHDLRRFLHNAQDRQDGLIKISQSMARAAEDMKAQKVATTQTLNSLQKQIHSGVKVQVDADLSAHIAGVSQLSSPLMKELLKLQKTIRQFLVMIGSVAFAAGILGSAAAVIAAFLFLQSVGSIQ